MGDLMIWLIRHGEIDLACKGRLIGQKDVQLSEKGRNQALSFRNLATEAAIGSIYCSDLSRSYQTATLISEDRNMPVNRVRALREISLGEWEGKLVKDIKERYPDQWKDRGENIAEYRPPSGESFTDLASRVIPAFESIVASTNSNTLIVGHAGVNRAIICHALGIHLQNVLQIGQNYGSMNVIQYRRGVLSVKSVNYSGVF